MRFSMDKRVNMDKQVNGAPFTCLCKKVWWRYLSIRGYFVFVLILLIASIEASCSDDNIGMDNDSIKPKGELIVTPIPDNAEPYKVYCIRHGEENLLGDKYCTFIFYFGDNPMNLSSEYIQVLDKDGNVLIAKSVYPPTFVDYVSIDDPSYNENKCSDGFKILSRFCEKSVAYFKYSLDLDDDGWDDIIKQPWETVHHYY